MEELVDPKGLEPLLTVHQVASWLNMSAVWVYKQAERGLLPFYRVGQAMRFNPEEIRSYLNQREGIKRLYGESRNPKVRKKKVFLVCDQEVKNTGL